MALTGRAVGLMLLGIVPALMWPTGTTVVLWVLLVVALIGLDVALAAPPRGFEVRRDRVAPLRPFEDGATTLHVRLPSGRRARGVLRDAWQPSAGTTGERHPFALAAGETLTLTTALRPTRRGDLTPDRVTIRSLGPLRLAGRQGPLDVPGAVRVLPAFPSRRHLPALLADLRALDGRATVRTRGQGTEFDSLRDYVPGDDVRSLDWRATARRGTAVVRTWRPERDRRIVLVLDTSRTSAGRIGDVPRLDAAMDAALLLTALAGRAGDRVDLVAGDQQIRCVSPGGRGSGRRTDRLHDVADAMSVLEPALLEANWTRLAARVLDLDRSRALVVLLTTLDPASVQETLLPALTVLGARHQVLLASVQDPALERAADPDTTDEVDTHPTDTLGHLAAAAEHDLADRRHTADVLTGLGVTVLDRPPDHLPADLARTYLTLKSRGRL